MPVILPDFGSWYQRLKIRCSSLRNSVPDSGGKQQQAANQTSRLTAWLKRYFNFPQRRGGHGAQIRGVSLVARSISARNDGAKSASWLSASEYHFSSAAY